MKYLALLSLLMLSQIGFAQSELANAQVQSVDILIHNYNIAKGKKGHDFVLDVFINGVSREHFVERYKISPGALIDNPKPGKEPELTPEGVFHPTRLERDYVSKQFGGKVLGIFETGAMPYTIFFYNGFAIHGSASTVDGNPASKGCVRLRKNNARKVFEWVSAAINNTGSKKSVKIHILHTEAPSVQQYRRK